jgi:hypothetical protein
VVVEGQDRRGQPLAGRRGRRRAERLQPPAEPVAQRAEPAAADEAAGHLAADQRLLVEHRERVLPRGVGHPHRRAAGQRRGARPAADERERPRVVAHQQPGVGGGQVALERHPHGAHGGAREGRGEGSGGRHRPPILARRAADGIGAVRVRR